MNFRFQFKVFVFLLGVIVVVVYSSYFFMGSNEDHNHSIIHQQQFEQHIRDDMESLKISFEKGLSGIAEEIKKMNLSINVPGYSDEELKELFQLINEVKAMEKQIQNLESLSSETAMLKEEIAQLKVNFKNRSSDPRLDTFIIKSEIEQLKTLINARPRIEGKKSTLPEDAKLLMIIPGFGPNNQYIGMMDSMFIAKQLGRVFVRPDFYLHAVNDLDSIRTFDLSFQGEQLNQYVPTTSVQEAIQHCGEIDSIIWLRNPDRWLHLVKLYMKHLGIKYTNVIYTPDNSHLYFGSMEHIKNYFSKVAHQKCIALCFPYESVYHSPERNAIIKHLNRSQYIKDVVQAAFEEMGTKPENLLSIHWRFGEDSCAWYSSPDPQYEFCWGTTVFHFARVSDVLFVLLDFIRNANVTHVYIAVASHYLDPKVMKQIENEFSKQNIKYFRSRDVPSLNRISDNYYLSLAEQEICSTSRLFCRSDSSTWSDFIVNWVEQSGNNFPAIVSLGELLRKHERPFSSWNRESQEEQLSKFKRPEGWNNV